MPRITTYFRKTTVSLGLLLLGTAFLAAGLPPAAASAGSCAKTYADTRGEADGYHYSATQYVAGSWSACHDINIAYIRDLGFGDSSPGCGTFRIRFYPSSGGSYANSWRRVCAYSSSDLEVLATNVANGTKYRVESYNLSRYSFILYD